MVDVSSNDRDPAQPFTKKQLSYTGPDMHRRCHGPHKQDPQNTYNNHHHLHPDQIESEGADFAVIALALSSI